ncbi:hypothetical protein HN51_032305 [Arachis hypogaea]
MQSSVALLSKAPTIKVHFVCPEKRSRKLRRLPHAFSRVLELMFGPMLMLPSRRPPIAFALSPRQKRRLKRLESAEVAATPAMPMQKRVPAREACVRGWEILYDELEVSEVA